MRALRVKHTFRAGSWRNLPPLGSHPTSASPDLIAPVMGHADTRKVELVYERLPVEDLRRRLAQALGTDCSAGATVRVDGGDLGGSAGPDGLGRAEVGAAATPRKL